MMYDQVVLVDSKDKTLGFGDKLLTHVQGRLHRAVSVIIYDMNGRMLLQRRAMNKYHSAGLWTNACCSHPFPGENPQNAGQRRLKEEMGISTALVHAGSFIYFAELEDGLAEHELDHVFIGFTNQKPKINPEEVCDYRYISHYDLALELNEHPAEFTSWFHIMCEKEIIRLAESEPVIS